MTQADRKKQPQELRPLLLDQGQHKYVMISKVQAFVWKYETNVTFLNTMCNSQEITNMK